jgi:hypothetical protein
LDGCDGRLTAKNGGFRPGQYLLEKAMKAYATRTEERAGAAVAPGGKVIHAPPCIFP